jgi:hypothetical protein
MSLARVKTPAFAGMTKEHEPPSEMTLSTACQAIQAIQAASQSNISSFTSSRAPHTLQ